MQIVPAPLTPDVADLFYQIDRDLPYYQYFQIDIADGVFVPNTTVSIPEILSHLQTLPDPHCYTSVKVDLHLMVATIEKHLEQVQQLREFFSINVVLLHEKLKPDIDALSLQFPELTIGLVLDPDMSVQEMRYIHTINKVPYIQIMSVKTGFQGGTFLEDTLYKIEQLRTQHYTGTILLDGGVNNETLPVIISKQYKPDICGVGSYLSKAENLEERVTELNTIIAGH